jgi:2-C-methyl-D-erythritol 4-phosphate cytidylyltransferase/2-C-methyl-D-erythritol 2,4-cyclodiphosphate synthase
MADITVAVVAAAGGGARMGGGAPKQYRQLAGLPLLTHSLLAVERAPEVQAAVVVAPPGEEGSLRGRCVEPFGLAKVAAVVAGGARRQDSVAAGAEAAAGLGAELVLVHDAARPLAPPELFGRVLAAARDCGAATAAAPCYDTVKEAGEGGRVAATLDRSRLWLVQTPQGFRLGLLRDALAAAAERGWEATDEAGLVERLGREVRLVEGPRQNLKVTTPADLRLARGWLGGPAAGIRVGQGLDVHALVEGRRLVLGGVELESPLGLAGHSDADVLTHAVMDALLSAAGLGDIGGMFPDTDPAWAGARSLELLSLVVERLAEEGLRPAQVGVTVAAQRPRLAPHAPAMRAALAGRLGLEPGLVNVAATTTEGLGLTGRGEGIAAWATAVLAPSP